MNNRVSEYDSNIMASRDIIEDEYYNWLIDFVELEDHSRLASQLYKIDFYSIVPNDENRAEDGKKLRMIFHAENDYIDYGALDDYPCSMLEMLIAISIRMEAILSDPDKDDRTVDWFWELLTNIGLDKFEDYRYEKLGGDEEVNTIVENILERRYSRTGKGGLFPLNCVKKDQRKVELWYQMSTYLLENYNFD